MNQGPEGSLAARFKFSKPASLVARAAFAALAAVATPAPADAPAASLA